MTNAWNAIFGFPTYSDVGVSYTPTFRADYGSWLAALPLTNVQDRRLHLVARSTNAALTSTRLDCDLGVERAVRVLALPAHNLSSAAKVRWRAAYDLFDWHAEDLSLTARTGQVGTHTRADAATCATYVNSSGQIATALANVARWQYEISANVCPSSEDFSVSWTADGTPTRVAAALTCHDPTLANGKVVLDLIGDDSGAAVEGYFQQVVFTGDAVKAFSIYLKEGTAPAAAGSEVSIYDWTGAAFRLRATVTWVAGVPSVAMTTGTYIGATLINSGVYRLSFATTALTAANNNMAYVYPAATAAQTGNLYAGGVQCENALVPTAYVKTTASLWVVPTLLLEGSRENVCTQSVNFGAWTAVGTPVLTAGQADPAGGVTAYLIEDDSAAAMEYVYLSVAFTGDGEKVYSIFVRQGTATGFSLAIRDDTAAAYRHVVNGTWSATNAPVLATDVGAGTLFAPQRCAGGWWRIAISATGVIAANDNRLYARPTLGGAALLGATYFWGAQAEDATFPSSYIGTAGAAVTRATDALAFTFAGVPQVLTAYASLAEYQPSTAFANNEVIGLSPSANPTLALYRPAGGYTAYWHNGSGFVTSVPAPAAAWGDGVEFRGVLSATGTVLGGVSVNGAAEVLGAESGSNALPTAFGATTLTVGSVVAGANSGYAGFKAVRVASGTQTLATMRAPLLDTGWCAVWPTGETLETLTGINFGYTYICAADVTARHWRCEIDDTTNAAGYVDLGRLIIAKGWQASVNFSYGARLGWEDDSTRTVTDGGAALYDVRSRRRTFTGTIEHLPNAEALASAYDMMRLAGTTGQVYFVEDPSDTANLWRRSFLAAMRELSPLERASYACDTIPFSLVEDI